MCIEQQERDCRPGTESCTESCMGQCWAERHSTHQNEKSCTGRRLRHFERRDAYQMCSLYSCSCRWRRGEDECVQALLAFRPESALSDQSCRCLSRTHLFRL